MIHAFLSLTFLAFIALIGYEPEAFAIDKVACAASKKCDDSNGIKQSPAAQASCQKNYDLCIASIIQESDSPKRSKAMSYADCKEKYGTTACKPLKDLEDSVKKK